MDSFIFLVDVLVFSIFSCDFDRELDLEVLDFCEGDALGDFDPFLDVLFVNGDALGDFDSFFGVLLAEGDTLGDFDPFFDVLFVDGDALGGDALGDFDPFLFFFRTEGDFGFFSYIFLEDGDTLKTLDSISELSMSLTTFCLLLLPLLDLLCSSSLLSSCPDFASESGTSELSICTSSEPSVEDSTSEADFFDDFVVF